MTEKPYKDFENWYTEVFGGHIVKEQASYDLHVAYDYYVDNRRLTVENTELEKEVKNYKLAEIEAKEIMADLQAQIEKMKCCYNCKHSRTEYEHCKTNKHEKWEIKND